MIPMVSVDIRSEPDADIHIAVVVDIRCPKCTELFTCKIVEGFVRSNVREGLTIADWSVVRKHAEACFEAEHKCWGKDQVDYLKAEDVGE